MTKQSWFLCALAVGAWAGCSAGGAASASGGGPYDNGAGGSHSGAAGGSGGSAGVIAPSFDAAAAPVTPEQEQNLSFLAPQAGARYVYVANPGRNRVDIIDSLDLSIVEAAPGDSPTYLATVPGRDIALVINVGSHTLSILSADALSGDPIPIVPKANAIAIAPDGLHAVIWFDATQSSGTPSNASSTAGSTQEVSVVTLTPATATSPAHGSVVSMTVGYNPSAVVFASDSSAAFVVTDDGISELRFASITASAIAPFTSLDSVTTSVVSRDAGPPPGPGSGGSSGSGGSPGSAGSPGSGGGTGPGLDGGSPLDGGNPAPDASSTRVDLAGPDTNPPPPEDTAPVLPTMAGGKPVDVSVTPDGTYAIARRDGSYELLLIDLKLHTVTPLDLSSTVTDLDLLPSGGAAFAVLRQESLLVRIDIPSGFFDAAHRTSWRFDGETVGSVTLSPQGKYALLYTTATPSSRLVIFDPARGESRPVNVHRTIRAIAVAPDENTALVLHVSGTASGSGGSSGGGSSGSKTADHGYTMVHLADGFNKLQDTPAEPSPFAITPSSTHAFVLLRDDKAGVRIAQRMELSSFLAKDFLLGSPPSSIAALADTHKVFVGQVYSEGRISFIDWETDSVQTVTGFALNGRIQQ